MNYMICKWIGHENNAATKATMDVNTAFENIGGEIILLWKHNRKILRNIEEMLTLLKLRHRVTSLDNIIVQWPLYSIKPYADNQFIKLPHKKLICFIQDIESYRYNPEDEDSLANDIQFLNCFDVVVVHNQGMSALLRKNGLHTNVVDWEICDYLIAEARSKQPNGGQYEICFVGNLQRSGFLYANSHNFQTHINLYGQINNDVILTSQLSYNGIYDPNDKTSMLNGHFGLIWEGSCLETCDSALGNYMKINNPNRLSLYLANDLPVITWRRAGLAKFVEDNKIGFTVDALTEIDEILSKMSSEQYYEMLANAKSMGKKVRNGYFAQQAIKKAIDG